MDTTILYFSWIKEKVGTGEETIDLPSTLETVADLVDWLKNRDPAYASAFEDMTLVRAALDQTHVPMDTPLGSAAEIAFFPPVTGG